MIRLLPVLVFLGSLTVLSCNQASPAPTLPTAAGSSNLIVVSTVSPIASLVENIGGTRIDLQGIVPEGTNSHTFEPAPSTATVLSRADLIVANGLFLEEPTIEMARANQKAGSVILLLGERAVSKDEWVFDFSFPESDGHPNPHLWTAPHLALRYAELIRDELAGLDPDNAGYYNQNHENLAARIADLDRRIVQSVETIPPQNRRLLTYHDSFPFFGSRYGLEIIGAVQPSDFGEPSAREVANLIDQIRSTGVPAIFGSEVFPSPIMEQIAREGGAEYIDQLRDDDLPGVPGDPNHTYLGLMAANVMIMAPALGGNADAFDDFDSSLVFEGESRAIYPQ
jgi:ABC-type Zn uptake system ZnuABC Zn-binding protein ZnuA